MYAWQTRPCLIDYMLGVSCSRAQSRVVHAYRQTLAAQVLIDIHCCRIFLPPVTPLTAHIVGGGMLYTGRGTSKP